MDLPLINIAKNNGEIEIFSFDKLKRSLKRSGASNDEADLIIERLRYDLFDGMTTKEVYKLAFQLLKKLDLAYASKYSLKKAVFDLGPSGYPFEKLVSALLKQKGFNTEVSVILNGECVTHEIDVLAKKDGLAYAIECKFHSNSKTVSNIKVPLYINSRFLDIQKVWNNSDKPIKLEQGWLITNTRFTKDAIDYGKCVGLHLMSWDYPKGNGISNNIDKFGLYPITALTVLKKYEKKQLIERDIILIKELLEESHVMKEMKIPDKRIVIIKSLIKKLCKL
jgi:Holliday junction resolvase-like predicted endonuclease